MISCGHVLGHEPGGHQPEVGVLLQQRDRLEVPRVTDVGGHYHQFGEGDADVVEVERALVLRVAAVGPGKPMLMTTGMLSSMHLL